MKKLFLLTLLFLGCTFVFSQEKNNYQIGLGETQIVLSNNFILPQKPCFDKSIQLIKAPWKDQILNVYGNQLSINIYNYIPQNIAFTEWITDSTKLSQYNFENLEFQIFKNNKISHSWRNVESSFTVDDKTTRLNNGKNLKASKILDQILDENDIVKISFRTKGGQPFLNCILNKISDDKVPLVCSSIHNDNDISLETFVGNALAQKKQLRYNFYEDWPSSYFAKYQEPIVKVDEKTKIAIFYRPKKSGNTKDMLEYRLLENSESTSEKWKKADDFIILHDFKPGKKYILQVKYRDEKQFITKEFFSEPKWFQNIWLKISIIIFITTLVGVIFLLLRSRKMSRLQKEQKAKLQFMSAQLNPHFLFNALNSIQGLINSGNIDKSNTYLTDFAKLMRSVLDFSDKELIPLSLEIKALKHYISLEQLRFSFRFDFFIEVEIPEVTTEVLPMLVQPILENSIRHGISILNEDGKLSFKVLKNNKNLIFEIKDNGKGFETDQEFSGKGINLTKDRIALFNSSSDKVKIEYLVECNNGGTKTLIIYKNLLEND
ncbi:histidine kinase [Chryseobacterium sp. LC2016-29]|uniref:sensor histidine kinase n=1 Tax=Chryseobacterium sp. LC2016-29 TaxID=2897331 RepID=UPI001E3125EA|nr:histidine kinase [Chryseobacterium sp. LC2016-29]MCD0478364.1 histidine kinase [Chryseobacterium sp. LC2016-29]